VAFARIRFYRFFQRQIDPERKILAHIARAAIVLVALARLQLHAVADGDFSTRRTPAASLTEQYQALLATEGVTLTFTEDGLRRIGEVAWQVNERTENIGARRLHTVLERLLDDVSFTAADRERQNVIIDAAYVDAQLGELAQDEDLSRFIL
jgi:ATP-dependent HslUV protease ATP-binding subunit HslU